MVGRIGRAGSWWLALVVVCAVGLLVAGVLAVTGRPHPGADPAAAGTRHPAISSAAAPTGTPGGSVSPTPVPAAVTRTSPAPAREPSPQPASSPRPSPRPAPSPVASSSPAQFLRLDPASGAATLMPTWSASACTGNLVSAQVSEYTLSGTFLSAISNVVATVTSPFSGQLQGSVGALLNFGGVSASSPGTLRWTVGCFSGPGGTGAQKLAGSVYVTMSADGSYSTSTTPPS